MMLALLLDEINGGLFSRGDICATLTELCLVPSWWSKTLFACDGWWIEGA